VKKARPAPPNGVLTRVFIFHHPLLFFKSIFSSLILESAQLPASLPDKIKELPNETKSEAHHSAVSSSNFEAKAKAKKV
jgi:hypothetical protein